MENRPPSNLQTGWLQSNISETSRKYISFYTFFSGLKLSNLVTCNTFVSRNETYCVTGSIKLHVYEPTLVDMKKLTHKVRAAVGENLTLECPSLRNFNKTDSMIKWYKVSE